MRAGACALTLCMAAAIAHAAQSAPSTAFPLEWNATWPTDRPYEIVLDRGKIAKMTGLAAERLRVEADGRRVDTVLLPGAVPSQAVLRFDVPHGTKSLRCACAERELPVSGTAATDNLMADSLCDPSAWKCADALCGSAPDGIELSAAVNRNGVASRQFACPPQAAGKPAIFEIELENLSRFAWGGKILLWQTNGRKILPETVVDSRWISHVRPPGRRFRIRAEGRIHPQAKFIRVEIRLPGKPPGFDPSGRPFTDGADLSARLLVSCMALRVGETIPFPGHADGFFAEDAEDGRGASLRFDGSRAFWYQTRSLAAWGLGTQVTDEQDAFFPFADGTVEAWFRPGWQERDARTFTLFEAAQDGLGGTLGTQAATPLGRMLALEYTPASGSWRLFFRDVRRREFQGTSAPNAFRIPSGEWSHVAVQWSSGGEGEVYVNGRRALTVDLKGMRVADMRNAKSRPNDMSPATCRLGASFLAIPPEGGDSPGHPFYVGAADAWRVSTGLRYAGEFRPERMLRTDGRTRAFFGFNRSFDGISGGGLGFIPGSMFAPEGRESGTVRTAGGTFEYHPGALQPDTDPDIALDRLNFPRLPGPNDFSAARRNRSEAFMLESGGTAAVQAADGAIADWVEIANEGPAPLACPILLNVGEIDPRSFSGIRETLGLDGLDDREKADRIFRYAVRSMDYFGASVLTFDRGGDTARGLSNDALLHLNSYCGFECRMLNILLSSMFTLAGDMPSGLMAGYRHTFEQVFYGGRNRLYDLSLQRFVPSFRNDEVASLGEIENEPGELRRCGVDYARYVRSGTRETYASGPVAGRSMGIVLNPGERFRAWFANDGTFNDLQSRPRSGVGCGPDPDDMRHATHGIAASGSRRTAIRRTDRVFPEFANGFISFDGAPASVNPAFSQADGAGFSYSVESPYPVVAACYRATRRDGSTVPLEMSTDGGATFRPLSAGRVTYAVRARHAYLVRVAAPMQDVARFEAETEVLLNPRVMTGRIRPGANRFTFRAESGGKARVSVGWREPSRRIGIVGGLFHGAIPGCERQTVLLAPGGRAEFALSGASPSTAAGFGGVEAKIANGRLEIADLAPTSAPRIAGVEIRDGECSRTLGVIVAADARLVSAKDARVADGARLLAAGGDSPQPRILFPAASPGARATFSFPALPAGRYRIYLLDRFDSRPERLNEKPLCMVLDGGRRIVGVGSPAARAYNFAKARFGREGERANWKWDVKWEFSIAGSRPESFDMPAFDSIECAVTGTCEAVELAGALVVPEPPVPFSRGLAGTLLGLNCQPERVHGRLLDGFPEFSPEPARTDLRESPDWLQGEIDRVHASGGGTVTVPAGRTEVRTLRLKSGVRLHLEEGAVLLGSTNRADYAGERVPSMIRADGAVDVSITGAGMIDGRGGAAVRAGCRPPHLIDLFSCTNVLVEGVRLRDAGSWMLQLRGCLGVAVRGVDIRNHAALCNDGLDIASSRVLVEDCTIDSGDDAIAVKTFSPEQAVEDVTIRNCRLASGCNAFKIGTESHGTVRRINVSGCRISPPSELLIWKRRVRVPGIVGRLVGSAAIAVESVDGGCVEDVTVRDVSGEGVQTPVFVRLGRRRESRRGEPGCIRRVLVEDVSLAAGSRIACSITGVKGLRPDGITLRNVRLVQRGGGTLRDVSVPVPEKESAYPENRMFDFLPLPAYGFYLRHADGVRFENVSLSYAGAAEERPAVFVEDSVFHADDRCSFMPPTGRFADLALYRPSGGELAGLRQEFWRGIAIDGGVFSQVEEGPSAPLLVHCGCKGQESMLAALNGGALRGWNVLLPSDGTALGVARAMDSAKGRYDAWRAGLKADDSGLALSLLADYPERWTAVTVCNPAGPVPDGLDRARKVFVHIVSGMDSASLATACEAFNRLADPADAVSDGDRRRLAEERKAWRKADSPPRIPGYEPGSGRRIVFRRRSRNATLSVCDAKRVVSLSPELDFLSEALSR